MPSDRLAFTIRDAAEALRLRPNTVRRLIAIGAIPTYRVGWRTFITAKALTRFQDEHAVLLDDATIDANREAERRRASRGPR